MPEKCAVSRVTSRAALMEGVHSICLVVAAVCYVLCPVAQATAADLNASIQQAVRTHASTWSADRRWLAQYAGTLDGNAYRGDGATDPPPPAAAMITFADALLADAASPTVDDGPACRQPWRRRLLQERLRSVGLSLPDAPPCPALARFHDTSEIELLFVAPSSVRASAGFGHVLIRLVGVDRSRDDITFEVSALTGMRHAGLEFLYRGMTGGFPLVFDAQSLQTVLHENRVREQRSLQRFALNLTAAQRHRVLDLLWQSERELIAPYRFFSRNCATYVLWLVETALDGDPVVNGLSPAWAAPAEAIDRLAAITMPHNHLPLLHYVPGSFQSTVERAEAARVAGDLAMAALLHDDRLPPPVCALWRQWRDLQADALAGLVRQTLAARPDRAMAIAAVLLGELAQRRAEVDQVAAAVEHMELRRLQPIAGEPPPDLATLLAWRKAYYAHEEQAWRRDRKLDQIAKVEDYLRRAPRSALASADLAVQAEAAQARAHFEAATDAYATVADVIDVTPAAAVEAAELRAHEHGEAERWGHRVIGGGEGGVGLGVAWQRQGAAQGAWATVLASTLWREELGQWRQTGLGPRTALVAADLQTHIGVDRGLPSWQGTRGRLLQFQRNLEMPIAGGWLRGGWGATVHMDFRPAAYAVVASLDSRLLVADGVATDWMAGLTLHAGPSAAMGIPHNMDLYAKIASFVQRRARATGWLGVNVAAQVGLRESVREFAATFDIPLDDREVWRTRLQFDWRCSDQRGCGANAQAWLQR